MTTQNRIDRLRQDSHLWTCDGKPTGNLIADRLCNALAIIAELEARLAVANDTFAVLHRGLHTSFELGLPYAESEAHTRIEQALAATDLDQPFAGPV